VLALVDRPKSGASARHNVLINGSTKSFANQAVFAAPPPDQASVPEVHAEAELPVEEDEVKQLNADAEAALDRYF